MLDSLQQKIIYAYRLLFMLAQLGFSVLTTGFHFLGNVQSIS